MRAMATVAKTDVDVELPPDPSPRRKLSVEDYHRMAEAGVLDEDERIELIDGEIVSVSPIDGPHIRCVAKLTRRLNLLLGEDAFVSPQGSVRLTDDTEPEPDVAVLRQLPPGKDPPLASDVLLLIEVSDTTLDRDRDVKAPRYARAAIPELWIVDLQGEVVLRFREPHRNGYGRLETFTRGQMIQAQLAPQVSLLVDDIFR
jgi:Uma2 family endonuclease